MSSVYKINKGINQPIEFRGLKAHYIWWLGVGIVSLLVLFTLLFIAGVKMIICVLFVFVLGASLFFYVYKISKRYGEHGMMKKMAKKYIPRHLRQISRHSREFCGGYYFGSIIARLKC